MKDFKDTRIKLYVACHKACQTIDSSLIVPIQVGAALTKERFSDMIPDNEGENISSRNRAYCELTAQYWAWKNDISDFYGFMHYRRYFSFSPIKLKNETWVDEKGNGIYGRIYDTMSSTAIEESCLSDKFINSVVSNYDVIVPVPDDMNMTVYEQYKTSPHHRIKDLDLTIKIIVSDYPDFIEAATKYLNSK
jgi:hypothetical protein